MCAWNSNIRLHKLFSLFATVARWKNWKMNWNEENWVRTEKGPSSSIVWRWHLSPNQTARKWMRHLSCHHSLGYECFKPGGNVWPSKEDATIHHTHCNLIISNDISKSSRDWAMCWQLSREMQAQSAGASGLGKPLTYRKYMSISVHMFISAHMFVSVNIVNYRSYLVNMCQYVKIFAYREYLLISVCISPVSIHIFVYSCISVHICAYLCISVHIQKLDFSKKNLIFQKTKI